EPGGGGARSERSSQRSGGAALHRSEGLARRMHYALHTRFCDLARVERPLVQTGMGWVSGARLTAATSAAGGLGILAAVTMTPTQLEEAGGGGQGGPGKAVGGELPAGSPPPAGGPSSMVSGGGRGALFSR